MARYLITGVAGFIGSSLAHELVARGETVRGVDNFLTGRRENIEPLLDQMDFREADLRDATAMLDATKNVDYILHQGALPSVPRSVEDPRTSHECNINGTLNLLEGARAAKVKRVVYAASSSAYGNQPGMPRVETMSPAPISPYAVQKLSCELYMQSYWRVYGLETVCLRYFNIFGPRQAPDSPYSGVLARFALQLLSGEQPTIFGNGEQGRDFTYIANVVSANLAAAVAPAEKVAGRVFNIACGGRHTLNKVFRTMAELTGYTGKPNYGPPRAGDVMDSQADISAAHEAFGYEPIIGFEEGLRRTVEWYKQTLAEKAAAK
jgi:UDP-glucose 4-epimerase